MGLVRAMLRGRQVPGPRRQKGALESPQQETGSGDVAQRGGDRRQGAEGLDRRFEHQVHGIETGCSRHAEQRQAADQEGDGDEGHAIEQAAEAVEAWWYRCGGRRSRPSAASP
jgi:hypothetical protein